MIVLTVLALTAGGLALWHRRGEPQLPSTHPHRVVSGSVSELAPAIRNSRRSIAYVGCPSTIYGVRAREWFLAAAADLASDGARDRVAFFRIEDETAQMNSFVRLAHAYKPDSFLLPFLFDRVQRSLENERPRT
jgi:hypothetical protein